MATVHVVAKELDKTKQQQGWDQLLSKQNHGSIKAEVSFRIHKKPVTVAVFKTKKWPN